MNEGVWAADVLMDALLMPPAASHAVRMNFAKRLQEVSGAEASEYVTHVTCCYCCAECTHCREIQTMRRCGAGGGSAQLSGRRGRAQLPGHCIRSPQCATC